MQLFQDKKNGFKRACSNKHTAGWAIGLNQSFPILNAGWVLTRQCLLVPMFNRAADWIRNIRRVKMIKLRNVELKISYLRLPFLGETFFGTAFFAACFFTGFAAAGFEAAALAKDGADFSFPPLPF